MIALYENRVTDFYSRKGGRLQYAAHLHPHLELVLLFEGNTTAFADSEKYELTAGDVFLTFPNQVHRYQSSGPEQYCLFIVNPEMLPGLSSFFQQLVPASAKIPGVANDPEIRELAERLCAQKTPSTPFEEAVRRGYLLALFGKLLSGMRLERAPVGESSHALKAVVSFCAENFTRELSLSTLEEALHISRYYISHLFSEKLQIGFNDYVNSLRVSHACRYLRHTDKSVTEIGSLVGFSTLRTFNRAFLKQMGVTPSKYRASK